MGWTACSRHQTLIPVAPSRRRCSQDRHRASTWDTGLGVEVPFHAPSGTAVIDVADVCGQQLFMQELPGRSEDPPGRLGRLSRRGPVSAATVSARVCEQTDSFFHDSPYYMTQGLATAASAADNRTVSSSGRGRLAAREASTASLYGPVYQGRARTNVAGAPEAKTTARPRSSPAWLETSRIRSLASWRERLCPDLPEDTETMV